MDPNLIEALIVEMLDSLLRESVNHGDVEGMVKRLADTLDPLLVVGVSHETLGEYLVMELFWRSENIVLFG